MEEGIHPKQLLDQIYFTAQTSKYWWQWNIENFLYIGESLLHVICSPKDLLIVIAVVQLGSFFVVLLGRLIARQIWNAYCMAREIRLREMANKSHWVKCPYFRANCCCGGGAASTSVVTQTGQNNKNIKTQRTDFVALKYENPKIRYVALQDCLLTARRLRLLLKDSKVLLDVWQTF